MVSELATSDLLRWIVLIPLLGAVLQGCAIAPLRRPFGPKLTVAIACGAVLASGAVAGFAFWRLLTMAPASRVLYDRVHTWLGAGVGDGTFAVDVAFQLDPLSAVMTFVVTGVGLLILLYSAGYMGVDERDDRGFQRFFVYMNLFVAAMLCLVLADNLVLLFAGWQGVSLCSYLLIGFWYGERANAEAAKKAFIFGRIGDFGFITATLLLFWSLSDSGAAFLTFRGLEAGFGQIADRVVALPGWMGGFEMGLPTAIGLLFLLSACGKSAQLPLHVWLPDAMAGPTPVSALIHAATMVAAGVYLVCRLSFIYAEAPGASLAMAWMGGSTALFAAVVAVAQDDIKKVLAYATISQLGLMFLALGAGAYAAAMFHVVTHAFFQATLFLGAGVVILAVDGEQDLKKMGGVRSGLLRTYLVVVLAALALAGFPLFSGFFSGQEILASVRFAHDLPGNDVLYGMALTTSGLTAFYVSRWVILCFHGPTNLSSKVRNGLRDPATPMMLPLTILGGLSVVSGLATLPQFWGDMIDIERSDSLRNFLSEVLAAPSSLAAEPGERWRTVGTSLAASALGWAVALWLYSYARDLRERITGHLPNLRRLTAERFRFDEFYDVAIAKPTLWFAERIVYRRIDQGLIDRIAVLGPARWVRGLASSGLHYTQSGLAQIYLGVVVVSAIAIVSYMVGR